METDAYRIKNPEKLFKKYYDNFKPCFPFGKRELKRPLTETEIIEKVKNNIPKIGKQSFQQKYLPRLEKLGMVFVAPTNEILTHNYLGYLYGMEITDKRIKNYYFFTPNSAKVTLVFRKIIQNFGKYMDNLEEIRGIMNHFITGLKMYEIIANTNQEYLGTFQDSIYVHMKKFNQLTNWKRHIQSNKKRVKILRYKVPSKVDENKDLIPIGKKYIYEHEKLKKRDKAFSEIYFRSPEFDELVYRATLVREENELYLVQLDSLAIAKIELDSSFRKIAELFNKSISYRKIFAEECIIK